MRVLKGKEIIEIDKIQDIVGDNLPVIVDIGTGDGKFVYKYAKQQPSNYYIGIDAVAENMMENAVKITKKESKGGLKNAAYVVASAENLPKELEGRASQIYVNLPWGSLLEGVVKCNTQIVENIINIAMPGETEFVTCFSYNAFIEEGEIQRRGLPELSMDYIENDLISRYEKLGIIAVEKKIMNNDQLKEYGTQWAKRLGFGRTRDVFYIRFKIVKL